VKLKLESECNIRTNKLWVRQRRVSNYFLVNTEIDFAEMNTNNLKCWLWKENRSRIQ